MLTTLRDNLSQHHRLGCRIARAGQRFRPAPYSALESRLDALLLNAESSSQTPPGTGPN